MYIHTLQFNYSPLPLLHKKSIPFGLFDTQRHTTSGHEKYTGFIQSTNIKKDFGNCAALLI